ncbi:hypothetical protein BGX20_003330 [Mortierella sp. AD010]|nr:hypothetical protein BGX20_003330 [Mortierella sp. AD010]
MPLLNSLRRTPRQNQSKPSNAGLSDSLKSPQPRESQSNLIVLNRQSAPAHNILFLPEFLYPLFSRLDQKSILSVRLVCMQWSSVARPYLILTTQWRDDLSRDQKAEVAARLALVNTLEVIDADDTWIKIGDSMREALTLVDDDSSSNVPTSEDPLLLALQELMVARDTSQYGEEREFPRKVRGSTLANHRQIQLQKLILTKVQKFEKRFENLLEIFPMLTCLELVDAVNTKVDMNIVLEVCPNLRRFVLEFALSDEILWATTTITTSILGTPSHSIFTHNLDTLILRHAKMDQISLESLCAALPNLLSIELRFLRVIQVRGDSVLFNRRGFYRSLARSCPRIESLHFSLYHCSLTEKDSVTLQDSFPVLKELSMAGKDLDDGVFGHRYKLLEYYSNFLTKLEILCYTTSQSTRFLERIHQFLCSARHLRHLIAPRLQYLTEYLDLVEAYDPEYNTGSHEHEITFYRPSGVAAGQNMEWKIPVRQWACQDLETLHLSFTAFHGSSTNAEHSRIMFGHISRYCPRLKDLFISKQTLNLHIDGGLCLLTRLKHLERLKISSHTKYFNLEVSDIDWIGQRVSVEVETDPSNPINLSKSNSSRLKPLKSNPPKSNISNTVSASAPMTAVRVKKSVDYFKSLVTRVRGKSTFATPAPARKTIDDIFEMDREWNKRQGRGHVSLTTSDLRDHQSNRELSAGSESGYLHWRLLRSFTLEVDQTHLFKDSSGVALMKKLH